MHRVSLVVSTRQPKTLPELWLLFVHVRIELMFWAGCPSHPEALELLREVLDERNIDEPIVIREGLPHKRDDRARVPGSPTIRVDGRDVDPLGAHAKSLLTCRVYRLPDGRQSPVPNRRQLRALT